MPIRNWYSLIALQFSWIFKAAFTESDTVLKLAMIPSPSSLMNLPLKDFDDRFLQFPVCFQQGEGFLFIAAHQGRITDNIREHDGCELTGL